MLLMARLRIAIKINAKWDPFVTALNAKLNYYRGIKFSLKQEQFRLRLKYQSSSIQLEIM